MDFLKRLFGRSKEKGYVSAEWTTLYPNDVIERELLERNREWVFVSVDKVANSVSAVRFKVMRYSRNDDDQEVFDHPMVDFLESPAPEFTGKDFIYMTTAYKELVGNAYWELKPGNVLSPLVPTAMRPILEGGKITAYEYYGEEKRRIIQAKNVLHDRYVDLRKPYTGVGKLEKIARWVDTSFYSNEFVRLFFINGAQFGGFIKTEEESEERIKLIKAGLANDHVGVQNAHKIAVLPKGSEFQAVTSKMSDMQFKELDDGFRDKIFAAFGVPKAILGLAEEVQRGNVESSEYIFKVYTIKPIVDNFIEFLNNKIAPLYDPTGKLYFSYDNFIPENEELKLKEREVALAKQPYKTVNEVRAEVGLPPIDGGDEIYSSPGVVLGEKPIVPELVPGDDPKDDKKPEKAAPARPTRDHRATTTRQVAPKRAPTKRARREEAKERIIEDIVAKAAEIAAKIDPEEVTHKSFVGRVEPYEERIAGAVRDFNNRQEREVQSRLARITKGVAKSDLFDMESEVGVMVDFVTPLLKGLMIEQAMEEYAAQGFEGVLNPENLSVNRFVEQAAKRLAKGYNNVTAGLLKRALNEGIANGESLDQLAGRVREVYQFSDETRAARVARTEAFYIANEGSREAYRQSGIVASVRWYTAQDERTCPFCGPLHGKIVGINEVFFNKDDELEVDGRKLKLDYRAIDVPPLHTNCRCFIRPDAIEI